MVKSLENTDYSMAVIQPNGAINAANAAGFQERLITSLATSETGLLVDMSAVDFLDSAGLAALVAALRTARHSNKQLTLCAVPPSLKIVFELTQLDRAFKVLEVRPEQAAIAA
ncbi:MAG: STAS domain-containing protein [Leptolyngbyaceae cyanobacterium SM1_1_3]|nr:STAS domain-containing protein [Leptolyngbyaceae cyanobacterium SM1_1_3]NJM85234.1 STAS domain-containing protein [Leptolyngbyaceae cyanobacterium RM2_2_21]NJN04304.1 STAS domain-containing protein [Leptolyngbyaceae cyanobacterium RM1_1_2]NJO10411.1 STAS domain-containing protein [Leptolyngbyaceae cyanobacterium SL_1_1]